MSPFPASQVPDEGYSEDPLNPSASSTNDRAAAVAALARLTSAADFPVWLSRHLSAMPPHVKQQLAMAILEDLPTSAIVDIVQRLNHRLYIDFSGYLPPEICLKILSYLDPVSLVNAAQACRSWYTLALDRKLWQRLYYLEGWKALTSEIDAWEAKVNEGLNGPSAVHHLPSENGHTSKKRALTPADQDMEMVDADSPSKSADPSSQFTSIFGGPVRPSSSRNSSTPQPDHYMMDISSPRPDNRGSSAPRDIKGKSIQVRDESLPDLVPSTTLPELTLWHWDSRRKTYKMNWKYLYTMRRRLERNWEDGRFVNFQLPHPDYPEEGHRECIYNIQYDSEYLVSGSRDRTLRIWDLQTRRLVRPPLTGHNGSVLCLQFDTDPEEDLIVSGSSDSDVIMWKFSTGEMLQLLSNAHTESVLNVKFDKRVLVTCSKDKTIKVFNRQPLRYGDLGYPRPGDIKDGSIHIVDPVPITLNNYGFDQSPRATMPVIPPYTMIRCLEGHGAAVNAVQVCDREIVSASGDRHIKLWDWHDKVCKRTFLGHTKGIACVQYDGRRIVSGSNDNAVRIFDRETGLEVASLHHHTELVRTLQAGFGDLPYSVAEDMAEAKAVDAEYFKAVEAGIVPSNPTNRSRVRNAGSRRPEDIVAYGAKLPPGGGGGKYGRIVSGSYDQTIIIWRRDREGVWKPAHVLDREDAATNAATHMTCAAQPDVGVPQVHPSVRLGPGDIPVVGTATAQSVASFQTLIDSIVPQGPARLQQALANYPTMLLSCYGYLQGVIDSQNNAIVRSQLHQVVQTAIVRTQMAQARAQQLAQNAASSQAGPSTATGGQQHITTAMATSTATAGAGQGQTANAGNNVTLHHPHIAPVNNGTPIRIFKLQFDARRIICCSTMGAIVGWDFCNGDRELEEVSRFFATVD